MQHSLSQTIRGKIKMKSAGTDASAATGPRLEEPHLKAQESSYVRELHHRQPTPVRRGPARMQGLR